jgi:hypothetical protein
MPPLTLITALYEFPTIAAGRFADIAIGMVAIEGVPEAASVEQPVVASNNVSRKATLTQISAEYRF